jgi:hypothetical protein
LTIVEGTVDLTKGPISLCVINPNDEEIIVRAGQIIASLTQMDRAVVTERLQYTSIKENEGNTTLPSSLFNIVTLQGQPLFTEDEQTEMYNLFGICNQVAPICESMDRSGCSSDLSSDDSMDEVVCPDYKREIEQLHEILPETLVNLLVGNFK